VFKSQVSTQSNKVRDPTHHLHISQPSNKIEKRGRNDNQKKKGNQRGIPNSSRSNFLSVIPKGAKLFHLAHKTKYRSHHNHDTFRANISTDPSNLLLYRNRLPSDMKHKSKMRKYYRSAVINKYQQQSLPQSACPPHSHLFPQPPKPLLLTHPWKSSSRSIT